MGGALDIQYDESNNLDAHYAGGSEEHPLFFKQSFRDRFYAGLSARAELSLPIFAINVGIGHNLLYHGGDARGWYQTLNLKTFLTRHLFIHTGYRLSRFRHPQNLLLGLGYRF
ncbi:MAG: hypothetical protein LIO90_07280 [Bacteroidales bacterium]|nr:hypothetical protein [Bacteroidales bacterium]